jgi:transposase InsO family protein
MNLWLTHSELVTLTSWPERTIRHKAATGELKTRAAESRGRNGKAPREYSVSSLPGEFHAQLMKQRLAESALVLASEDHHLVPKFPTQPPPDTDARVLLSTESREQADYRLRVIEKALDFRNHTNGHKPVYRAGNVEITKLTDMVDHIAKLFGLAPATVWDWYSRYTKSGYDALADRIRSDKGKSRFFTRHPVSAEFVQDKWLNEKIGITRIMVALKREWPKLRNIEFESDELPSYNTVRNYIEAIPKPLTIVSREGHRGYTEKVAPYLLTDYDSMSVNDEWVSDHCIHDVWVRNDGFFRGLKEGDALRPWLTAIMDMRSRRILGIAWCATPSSNSISSALHIAISQFGIPKAFYIDNGKDYRSMQSRDVLGRLNIETKHCLPRHPQSKNIERFFGTMHQQFDRLWGNFYAGTSPKTRPESCDEVLRDHKKWEQGKIATSPLPPASQFIQMAAQWFDEYNSFHSHTGLGMNGRTPNEVYDAQLPPSARTPIDPVSIREFFWHREKLTVHEGGHVKIFGTQYEPVGPDAFARLFPLIRTEINVACDPDNLGEAIALDMDGNVLGAMRSQKLIARGPVSRDDVRASMRQRRAAEKAVRNYMQGLHQRVADQGFGTELDNLRQRTGKHPAFAGPAKTLQLPAPRRSRGASAALASPEEIAERSLAWLEEEK